MQTRREFAQAQRSSAIFETDDPNIIHSPNHGRGDRAKAYRRMLQDQMESDMEQRKFERAHADDHPLEMRVEKVMLKERTQRADDDDGINFFIGADESQKKDQRKAAQQEYKNQLENDMRKMKDLCNVDENAGRKPYVRNISPVEEGFQIGQDEEAVKRRKKAEAAEFYRQERARNPVEDARTRNRRTHENDNSGFFIGADENEINEQKARMRIQYRGELDEQKSFDDERRAQKAQQDRMEMKKMATGKLPYTRF